MTKRKITTGRFGVWLCGALVVGNMVGSGIFLLPGSLAEYGAGSLLGWGITAVGALMTALVFVRLSRRSAIQGGPYGYARTHLNDLSGFSVAWSYWFSIWCGNAAIATAAISYLGFFVPQLNETPALGAGLALLVVWTITWINLQGVQNAGRFQLVTTVLKILPLLAIGLAAIFVFDSDKFAPFNPTSQSLPSVAASTAALTLWAFLGLESATIAAEDVIEPEKTIPRATLLGFGLVTLIYLSTQITILSTIEPATLQHSGAPFSDAAVILWGPFAGKIIAATAIISCIGTLNGWILLQGQVPMTAARDGLFPSYFVDRKEDGLPRRGILIGSVLISILVVANYNDGLVKLFSLAIMVSTMGIFVPYLASIAVDLKLNIESWKTKPQPLAFVFSLLAAIYCLWAISGIGQAPLIWGSVLLLAGLPLYGWMKHKKKQKFA